MEMLKSELRKLINDVKEFNDSPLMLVGYPDAIQTIKDSFPEIEKECNVQLHEIDSMEPNKIYCLPIPTKDIIFRFPKNKL